MGIFCEINLNTPPDGAFYGGEHVTGTIKYVLDEPMDCEKIIISLKGMGRMRVTERRTQNNRKHSYHSLEVYVDTDDVIQQGNYKIPVGSHEQKFMFKLPKNIPPSFEYSRHIPKYRVECKIKYYVRIRFDRPGWFSFAKHYRKEIIVASTISPKLPMTPVMYGERSKLLQLFSSKTSTVVMKADILNSIIPNGGKIVIQSEVENDTNVTIKTVEIKLIEVHTFRASGCTDVKDYEDVPYCESRTASIKSGVTQNMPIEINVPIGRVTLDNSKIVSRDYIVRITAMLPIPHRNVVLEIPLQIGDNVQRPEICDPPPSYWEAMGETQKDDDASDDEACGGDDKKAGGDEKGEKS